MTGRVIWIDGAPGVGKTEVARRVRRALDAFLSDPEEIGEAMRNGVYGEEHRGLENYREVPLWLQLTRQQVAASAAEHEVVVVPQTLPTPGSFDATVGELRRSIQIDHFTLVASPMELERRRDERTRRGEVTGLWSIREIALILATHRDPRFRMQINTDALNADEVAAKILRRYRR